ncbi:MAG: hypothetical protein GY868_07180 [Deltaproteobacteria bacterium]|nr:hypothetical protein [Deltaproteobacteria bacterium]
MKKLTLALIAVVFCAWGCTHSYNSMMTGGIDLQGEAKYEILGDTEGTANVTVILGFIKLGDSSMTGSFPAANSPLPIVGGRTACEQAAAYKAIQNFEGADQIICPRFKTELTFGIPRIYEVFTSTVKAKAIKIKK